MIKTEKLPDEYLSGTTGHQGKPEVRKRTITGIAELQQLEVSHGTKIDMHDHDNLWEVWILLSNKMAFVCLKGEEHELVNNSSKKLNLMAIKGREDYTFEELADFFKGYGFTVVHGSMYVDD